MAADEERAQRIRTLKEEHPDWTWRFIADQCGVTERAAAAWAKTGGIAYVNAKKLADVFDVDVGYIWRGRDSGLPEQAGAAQLDRIEAKVDELREHFGLTGEGVP